MPDVQVQCIRKSNPERAHEHITHLGGHGWKWPIAQVIRSIEAGDNTPRGTRFTIELPS